MALTVGAFGVVKQSLLDMTDLPTSAPLQMVINMEEIEWGKGWEAGIATLKSFINHFEERIIEK